MNVLPVTPLLAISCVLSFVAGLVAIGAAMISSRQSRIEEAEANAAAMRRRMRVPFAESDEPERPPPLRYPTDHVGGTGRMAYPNPRRLSEDELR